MAAKKQWGCTKPNGPCPSNEEWYWPWYQCYCEKYGTRWILSLHKCNSRASLVLLTWLPIRILKCGKQCHSQPIMQCLMVQRTNTSSWALEVNTLASQVCIPKGKLPNSDILSAQFVVKLTNEWLHSIYIYVSTLKLVFYCLALHWVQQLSSLKD